VGIIVVLNPLSLSGVPLHDAPPSEKLQSHPGLAASEKYGGPAAVLSWVGKSAMVGQNRAD
jgi:hypothetical protein